MKILRHAPEKVPNVEIVGVIDESADFSMIDQGTGELHIDCYEVSRINSVGIRKWIIFFNETTKKGVKVFFYRISTALTEQFNYIQNFGAGGQVVSVSAPYICESCKKVALLEKFRKEVSMDGFEDELMPCPYCKKKTMRFDDVADDFFFFWRS